MSSTELQRRTSPERDATADDAEDDELPVDDIFHLLQNTRRRRVLWYLRDADGPVRMRDIAERVAAWEHDTTVEELSSDQRQRVYIPLYQSHLPKLDKAGVIAYQQSRGIVERKPLADKLECYLEVDVDDVESDDADDDDPAADWEDYYIGATVVGGTMLLGAVLELPVFSLFTGIGIGALILLMFTVLTFGRYVDR